MRFAKFFLLFSVLVAAAACAPKQKEAAEPSALDVIFSRKSVRSYTDQAVTDAQIETLLRAAMAAPTGMNAQPWRFVVVRDQAVKDALAGPRGGMIAQARRTSCWPPKPWASAPSGRPLTRMRTAWSPSGRLWAFPRMSHPSA